MTALLPVGAETPPPQVAEAPPPRIAEAPPLRIAVYMQDLSGGGVERMTLDLIREFQANGHAVTLLLHARRGELAGLLPPGVEAVSFGTRRVLSDVAPLARWLHMCRPDVLLANLNHNNIAALLAKLRARSRTRVIICQHNALSMEAAQGWKYRAVPASYHLLSPLAAAIVAVSDGVAGDVSRATRIARHRITTIYNPVIAPDFEARAAEAVSHPWFDEPGPPIYVAAGRLVAQKDHASLLRGFARHCAGGAAARLMILGDGPLRAELEALSRALGVADRVAMPGFVANPLPYMRRAAALVLTSRYEGFGNVVVEALGVGTPVISVDCSFGPSEILDGGRYGRLLPVGSVEALAAAFSPSLRETWPSEVLRARARAFTVAASAARYLALMRRVLPAGVDAAGLARS
jgi:glycosyltransferase involved in cell wall biosynthesis